MPYKGRRKGGPGSAGGRAVVAKYGRAHMARIGLLGAQALLDNHGCEHMREIGRNGYYKVMARHGIERPQPPIPWSLRRFEAQPSPTGTQVPLFLFDDLDQAA
ncbi:MAG TPA: hypothetical protein VGD69_07560 [Herpetosiphonaceae bacterium]